LNARRRLRRIAWIVALSCATPIAISFTAAISGPSNSSFTIRAFEWLRDNGAAKIASSIEGIYYSLNAPSTGGPALHALSLRTRVAAATHPPDLSPMIRPALPGEGTWVPTETWSGARPPVQEAQYRSDPAYPRMVAGVAWIDPRRTSISLYAGRLEPSVSMPRGPMEVPTTRRPRLLATFNSGFKLQDSGGGFALGGHAYAPLHRHLGTLIGYRDGRVDIQSWQGGTQPPSNIAFARQNLPLIVNRGLLNPKLNDGPQWGTTLGNSIRVWRSGVGVDHGGNLIYAAADNQTAKSLAQILRRAGAIELDINSTWVSFNTYSHRNAHGATKLLPGMNRDVTRYLTPDDRDFFAVYRRR